MGASGWMKAGLGAAALVLPLGGCVALVAGAAAGAGAYAYVTGELKSTVDSSLERTFAATKRAVDSLKFSLTEEASDALQAKVGAKMADDRSVSIELKRLADASTEIRIRVGTFGDESVSATILEEIKKGL
ncbi:MAG: DUF3568 family protein [Phycisphaeraceae bacterium]|nr:DUF3568 family protein [Phycisphaeraceae bacterium]MCW5754543.1 DUF3568 family protein [Phycisphaeraceae bacterium]